MTATLDVSTRIYAEDGGARETHRHAVWIIEVLLRSHPAAISANRVLARIGASS